jgi:hypothetical protein
MDLYLDRWLICPCGCGKQVSLETTDPNGMSDKQVQQVWNTIVAEEGLEFAIDDIFHSDRKREGGYDYD